MLHKNTVAFSWDTPEFEVTEKKNDWYWMVGIGAVILIITGIVLHSYLFSFLILIAAFLMFQMSRHEPINLRIEISEQGILYHNEMFNYENVFHFWINETDSGEAQLRLVLNRRLMPRISISIPDTINTLELREYLLEFVDEQKIDEPITNQVIKKIKF